MMAMKVRSALLGIPTPVQELRSCRLMARINSQRPQFVSWFFWATCRALTSTLVANLAATHAAFWVFLLVLGVGIGADGLKDSGTHFV